MKISEKIESIFIWIHTDIKRKENIAPIVTGLKSSVNQEYYMQGYDVSDAFSYSSDNGFNGRFYIKISPTKSNGDSLIDIVDEDIAKLNPSPTLESLTISMIGAIRNRKGLPYAFVYRSDIPGLGFLENHIVKEDSKVYVLKCDINELML